MALDTHSDLQHLVIYEVYVRNHGPNGTFADVEADLGRIKSMGVDVVWFMPIHPIGVVGKKGSLGCPYAIQDYRGVNPEYGTREDFGRLVEAIHASGMRVMIDVVFNHTSPDSVLAREHPEYFHLDANGKPTPTVPDWSDVVDLKHPNPGLTEYLVETLKGWAAFGVDGFRCDVASFIPQEFWLAARSEVAKVKPGVIWLAESVHAHMIYGRRRGGLPALSDSETYAAFDLLYDYDIYDHYKAAARETEPVRAYLEMLHMQECVLPTNFLKMRCPDNHDQRRILREADTREKALAWIAFNAFLKGPFLIYAGLEAADDHLPSLFEIDKVKWGSYDLQGFVTRVAKLKKDLRGLMTVVEAEPALQAAWSAPERSFYGVFNVGGCSGTVTSAWPNGEYEDVLTGERVRIKGGKLPTPRSACILRADRELPTREMHYTLL